MASFSFSINLKQSGILHLPKIRFKRNFGKCNFLCQLPIKFRIINHSQSSVLLDVLRQQKSAHPSI